MSKWTQALVFVGIVVAGALSRWIPHPVNFTPVLALALFAGAKSPSKWAAFALPIGAVFLSDLLIGLHPLAGVVYVCLIPMVWAGAWLERRFSDAGGLKAGGAWLGAGIVASAFFYVVTNFAVWLSSGMYPLTWHGLAACYAMALPFFQNQLASTLLFTAGFLLVWQVSERLLPKPAAQGVI